MSESARLYVPVVIRLPSVPAPPLSLNIAIGKHWAVVRRQTEPWRDAVTWVAKSRRAEVRALLAEFGPPLIVQVTLPFAVNRRKDAHNFTPTLKAIIDGLVIAGCLPDDSVEWVTALDPKLVVGDIRPKIEIGVA